MNEVVKHHNDLNTIPMRKWSKEEMNFFFAIIAKLRDQGTREVSFDKHTLATLANYSIRANKDYAEVIDRLSKNVLEIQYMEKKHTTLNGKPAYSLERMNLFSKFQSKWTEDLSDLEIKIKVSDEFEYVLNKLNSEFTSYELIEFTQIRSTYAKTIYRLLKQWRTLGKKEFSLEDFKRILDTPDYYGPSHIDKNILEPVIRELPQFFPGLRIKKVKANTRGNPVKRYIFTWNPEKSSKWIDGKYDEKQQLSGTRKKVLRKEKLPDWAKEDYVPPKNDPLTPEQEAAFKQRLKQFRAKTEK